eukprot:8027064-Alexandrium_andersonii.AAC.1
MREGGWLHQCVSCGMSCCFDVARLHVCAVVIVRACGCVARVDAHGCMLHICCGCIRRRCAPYLYSSARAAVP